MSEFNPYEFLKEKLQFRPFNDKGEKDGNAYYIHRVDVMALINKMKYAKEPTVQADAESKWVSAFNKTIMKLNNIEFRWSECNKSYELVKWQESETCYVVAFFRKHKEGYDMETVGDRFFKDHDAWIVGKHAINFLNDIFDNHEIEQT